MHPRRLTAVDNEVLLHVKVPFETKHKNNHWDQEMDNLVYKQQLACSKNG